MKKKKRKKLFYCKSGLMLEKNAQQCCGIFTVGQSKAIWTGFGQHALGYPALGRCVRLDHLQRSFPTSNIPQFYDSDGIMWY